MTYCEIGQQYRHPLLSHGHPRPFKALQGHSRSFTVIHGHSRSFTVIHGHSRSSKDIEGHRRTSTDIEGHRRTSKAYRGSSTSSSIDRQPPHRGGPFAEACGSIGLQSDFERTTPLTRPSTREAVGVPPLPSGPCRFRSRSTSSSRGKSSRRESRALEVLSH